MKQALHSFQVRMHELLYACHSDPMYHVNYVGFTIDSVSHAVVFNFLRGQATSLEAMVYVNAYFRRRSNAHLGKLIKTKNKKPATRTRPKPRSRQCVAVATRELDPRQGSRIYVKRARSAAWEVDPHQGSSICRRGDRSMPRDNPPSRRWIRVEGGGSITEGGQSATRELVVREEEARSAQGEAIHHRRVALSHLITSTGHVREPPCRRCHARERP